MALAPRLELRQSQSLVMTQQLQQSIKLLQLGALELREFVEQELEKNPFLEMAEEGEQTADAQNSENDQDESPEAEDTRPEYDMPEAREGTGADQSEEWEYTPVERIAVTPRGRDGEELDPLESQAHDVTLKEHLINQLNVHIDDPVQRKIGVFLIDLVDEAGYIKEALSSVAEQLGTKESAIEQVLFKLQKCDPAGVCARNLTECLSLQLKELDRFDPAMETMVTHLHLLAAGQLEKLQKLCGVDAEDLRDMIAEIRALNPKPGMQFQHEVTQTAEPDVIVQRDGKGKWHVELNTGTLPRVLINQRYYATVAENSKKSEDRKYCSEAIASANWLVKSLDQRAHTILKVATEIVAQQDSFFRMGIHHLKPLTLKDVARVTGFHESTVSRVTTGKYLLCPRGLFELKYFFTSSVTHGAGGEDVSSQTVKHLIKEMIAGEDAKKPLSDDEIARRLKEKHSIVVARRTVTKYREAEGLGSSTDRRRLKLVIS